MSGEDSSLSKLADSIKTTTRSDRHCVVWMAAAGAAGPTDRITLLEEAAETACAILPRYECTPLADRVTDLDSGRQMQGICIKKAAIPKLLSTLLFTKNKKVEVYRKVKGGNYQLTNSGTPADFDSLKDLLDPEVAASFGEDDGIMDDFSRPVAALSSEKAADGFPRIALFVLDKGARAVNVCSFADSVECDLLESVLENVSPLECRVAKNWDGDSGAGKVLLSKGIAVVKTEARIKRDFDEAVKSLEKYVDFSKYDLSVLERDENQGVRTGQLVADLLASAQSEEGPNKKAVRFTLDIFKPDSFVRLSASTLEGLHIFEGAKSLFSILNRTRTSGGERLMRNWLRQPLYRAEDINRRLDVVKVLMEEVALRKMLHENALRRIPDLQKVYKKLQTKRLTLQDLYKAYCAVKGAGTIAQELEERFKDGEVNAMGREIADPLSTCLPKLKKFEQLCEKTLDDDALKEGEYRVRASFDETLTELKEKIDGVKGSIQKSARKEAQRLGIDFEKVLKLESSSQHGWYMRVTLKDERLLRQKKGVRVFDSTKAGVKFRTPPIETLNGEFEELAKSYEMHQQYIVDEILQIAEGYGVHLLNLYNIVSKLDCLVSFAVAADTAPLPYVKPDVIGESDINHQVLDLKEARHPILEQMGVNFIPNDKYLDRTNNFKIITGPNLGGKSTYMRTAGLCAYMAQVGSFVPCSSARLTPVDAILVRMGAGDCQRRGVSTFMAEMLDAARILRDSSSRSLVLIDELGRGTSTYDGFGLAWAIAHRLATSTKKGTQKGVFGFFATHFHEMTQLAEEVPTVSNLFCDALVKDGEFTLLYTIQPGISHNSFGIEVARIAGFPKTILDAASKYLEEAQTELKGAFKYQDEMKRLVDAHDSAEKAGNEDLKRKIKDEARELAKKIKCEG